MSGDDLTLRTTLFGTALGLATLAVDLAGWNSPWVIGGLFAAAGVLFAASVFWPWLAVRVRVLRRLADFVARSVRAQFWARAVLMVVLWGAVYGAAILAGEPAGGTATPPWTVLAFAFAGVLGLILWDARRRPAVSPPPSDPGALDLGGYDAGDASAGDAETRLRAEIADLRAEVPRLTGGPADAGPPAPSMSDVAMTTSRLEDDPAEMERRLYVGSLMIDVTALRAGRRLTMRFFAYNAVPHALDLAGSEGRVSYASASGAQEAEWIELPRPTLTKDGPGPAEPFSEFSITLSQPVPETAAARIEEDLSAGDRVLFVFEDLRVHLSLGAGGKQVRLPIWERATCERTKAFTCVIRNHVIRQSGLPGRKSTPAG